MGGEGAAFVLSFVDARSGMGHLVAVETVALHRRSGRYPALVRRLTRRWIAPAGSRGSEGGDLWATRLT